MLETKSGRDFNRIHGQRHLGGTFVDWLRKDWRGKLVTSTLAATFIYAVIQLAQMK